MKTINNNLKRYSLNPDPFENGIIEIVIEKDSSFKILAYIHKENPKDMGEYYICFPDESNYLQNPDVKGGIPLKDVYSFLKSVECLLEE